MWRTKRSTEKSRFRPSDGCRGPKGRGSRCEAARAAIRFGGQVREDVLKCTIAPGFCPKGGPEVGLISLFFLSLSPPLSLPAPLPPLRRNPGSPAVNLISWHLAFSASTSTTTTTRYWSDHYPHLPRLSLPAACTVLVRACETELLRDRLRI